MTRPACVYRAGHWSPRDLLAGLSPLMREALADAARAPLRFVACAYVAERGSQTIVHRPSTVHALARKGLLIVDHGKTGLERDYRITKLGRERAAEIARRAANRAALRGDARQETAP